jgi:hypothetical protein
VIKGRFDSPTVTLELTAPRGAEPLHVYAAAWQGSGNPPSADVKYAIDFSTDAGKTWTPIVKDWSIAHRPPEPADFWSQSFTWGDAAISAKSEKAPVRVRFTNTGGKPFHKAEAYLTYRVPQTLPTRVTFSWKDPSGQSQTASHSYAPRQSPAEDATWHFDAGDKPQTEWVEIAPM